MAWSSFAWSRAEKGHEMPKTSVRPARVLQVGTDPAGLRIRGRILYDQGYCVVSHSNGFEAIQTAAVETVDVILIDLDRNGAEMALIAEQIKTVRPGIPTIVLTDSPRGNETHKLRHLADVIVRKKHGAEALVKGVDAVLKRKPELLAAS